MLGDDGFTVVQRNEDDSSLSCVFPSGNLSQRDLVIDLLTKITSIKGTMIGRGMNPPDSIMIWIQGVLQALVTEQPNPVPVSAKLRATSGVK